MTIQADAVVFTKPHTVEFKKVRCPAPGADDVVVRVTRSWISNGTEGSYLRGERVAGDTAYRSGDPVPFPIVSGYQKVGVVEQVGANIADLAVGETVFCACGQVEGMFTPWSGHVSPSISPRSQIWKLPDGADPLAFAGLVLTQVGYNSGNRAPLEPGQAAVVLGDGMVGQWAAQTLAWRGADVFMVGQDPWRLTLMERLTGGRGINMLDTDWAAELRRLVPEGLAVAADAVGTAEGTETVLGLLARHGHVVSAGFCGTDDRISLQALRNGELSLDSVSGWDLDRMDHTRALIAKGSLQTLPLITHRFPVAQAAEAWRIISSRSEPVLGVILEWS